MMALPATRATETHLVYAESVTTGWSLWWISRFGQQICIVDDRAAGAPVDQQHYEHYDDENYSKQYGPCRQQPTVTARHLWLVEWPVGWADWHALSEDDSFLHSHHSWHHWCCYCCCCWRWHHSHYDSQPLSPLVQNMRNNCYLVKFRKPLL